MSGSASARDHCDLQSFPTCPFIALCRSARRRYCERCRRTRLSLRPCASSERAIESMTKLILANSVAVSARPSMSAWSIVARAGSPDRAATSANNALLATLPSRAAHFSLNGCPDTSVLSVTSQTASLQCAAMETWQTTGSGIFRKSISVFLLWRRRASTRRTLRYLDARLADGCRPLSAGSGARVRQVGLAGTESSSVNRPLLPPNQGASL